MKVLNFHTTLNKRFGRKQSLRVERTITVSGLEFNLLKNRLKKTGTK